MNSPGFIPRQARGYHRCSPSLVRGFKSSKTRDLSPAVKGTLLQRGRFQAESRHFRRSTSTRPDRTEGARSIPARRRIPGERASRLPSHIRFHRRRRSAAAASHSKNNPRVCRPSHPRTHSGGRHQAHPFRDGGRACRRRAAVLHSGAVASGLSPPHQEPLRPRPRRAFFPPRLRDPVPRVVEIAEVRVRVGVGVTTRRAPHPRAPGAHSPHSPPGHRGPRPADTPPNRRLSPCPLRFQPARPPVQVALAVEAVPPFRLFLRHRGHRIRLRHRRLIRTHLLPRAPSMPLQLQGSCTSLYMPIRPRVCSPPKPSHV